MNQTSPKKGLKTQKDLTKAKDLTKNNTEKGDRKITSQEKATVCNTYKYNIIHISHD